MPSIETVLFAISILLIVSVISSKLSAKLSLPALSLFLGIGMIAGSEGFGGIHFDDYQFAQSLGVVALIFILFSGGLDTSFAKIRPVILRGILLSTVGVLITVLVVAGAVLTLLDFSPVEAFLVGSIVAATDAAAVFSILGTQKIALKGNTIPLLELESGSNDPMAIFLTIATIEIIQYPETPLFSLLLIFIQQMVIALILGSVIGYFSSKIINRLRLQADGLYPVFTSAFVLFTFGATALLGGSGFLAVYILGLVMANQNFVHKNSLVNFHDGLSWLMQIIMFLSLGLLVFPSQLPPIALEATIIAVILIFVGRPLGVFIVLMFSQFDFHDKLMISWVGLRGATPIVLAIFPVLAGISGSDIIFNIVFFVVLISVTLQGSTLITVAKFLGITIPYKQAVQHPFELRDNNDLRNELVEITISKGSPAIDKQIVNIGLPESSLIVLISRNQNILVPNGNTIIEADDILLVLADKTALKGIHDAIDENKPIPNLT
ncbi:MAG: potassium/proton antiporter [Phototrophicaceae bacterium]